MINKQLNASIYVKYLRELNIKHSSINSDKSYSKNYKIFKLIYETNDTIITIGNIMIDDVYNLKKVIKEWNEGKFILLKDFSIDIITNHKNNIIKKIIKITNNLSIFEFNYDKKETWKAAVNYGLSLGIPKEQLDFLIE